MNATEQSKAQIAALIAGEKVLAEDQLLSIFFDTCAMKIAVEEINCRVFGMVEDMKIGVSSDSVDAGEILALLAQVKSQLVHIGGVINGKAN